MQGKGINRNCLTCGKEFYKRPYYDTVGKGKYCCKLCYRISRRGEGKGTKGSFVKGDIKLIGANNHKWKGDDVGYFGLHSWLSRKYGKPVECEKCGSTKKIGWASKNYKYTRDRKDWIHLCSNCNFEYDRKNGWGIASKIYPEIRSSYALS